MLEAERRGFRGDLYVDASKGEIIAHREGLISSKEESQETFLPQKFWLSLAMPARIGMYTKKLLLKWDLM